MRLFAGLAVPQSVGLMLTESVRQVASSGLRHTALENLHVTLYFLGEVPEYNLANVCDAMNTVPANPVQIVVRRTGTFRRAGVLFAEVDPTPALLELERTVATALGPFAARPDQNSPPLGEYHPHITLARTRGPLRLHSRELQEFLEPVSFNARSVHLYRSRPTAAGSLYEIVHTIS